MADLSVLAAKGAATQPNTPSSLGTNKEKSILSQLAAGEKTESMIDFEENLNKNNGGFFGGIGYFFEKLGLGILSSIEGIWDYTAGGLAKLFGADDWAEQQFANDWVNYNHADEWYNPSDGWKVAGDVAGGIGTSIPAIATVAAAGAIAVASGGTLTPVAAALISGTVAGLGAAGNATKEAYRQTGELGGKEFGYGALVGITEGAVEGISAGIGAGTGQVVKNISKSFGKEIAETATRETLGKAVVKGFIGEAFEEGLSEILDPVWARLTYDPNAKNATFQEVGYAALIGGLSGAIMGGVDVSVRNVASTARGNKIVSEGKANNVIQMAEQLNSYENTNKTGLESFELVQSVYTELQNSMQKTNGQITTMKQKMLLGVLERANTTAVFSPIVARSAENIVNNADLIAQKLNSYGYTDANGKAITFTTEQIKNGVDINDSKTFSKALKTNDVLRSLAVADATGQITMNTAKFQEATLMGQKLSSQVDLNRFIETATDSELQAVGEKLGINNWQSLTNAEFQEKITEFVRNDGVESYKKERLIVKDAENLSVESAKELPKRLNMTEDGAVRYTQGDSQIAIIKDGDNYRMYDYQSKRLSKVLTKQEVNKVLRQLNTQAQTVATEVRQQLEQESTLRQQAAEIDSYARENIADYQKLNSANQSMVRAVIRQGRAAGIAEADVLSYARVSAHTGLNITYSKDLCVVGKNTETGENVYSDGYYDPNNNRIVVNPETKRTHEALLLHELDHAIRKTPDGGTIIEQGVKNMSKEEKEAIINRYRNAGRGGSVELIEEINAHYAEGILTNKNLLEKLCESKPTLKEKILNFFKKSKSTYSEDVKLSKEAQSLYKRYKKLFDEFSARNQGNNAAEISAVNTTSEAYALAKDSENDYNNQKGVENGQETTETTKTTEAKENGRSNESLRGSRGRGISVFNDYGTVRQLSEIVKNTETVQKIGDFFTEIYTEPQTDTQENLVWHAKNEDINIYFAKTKENAANVYFYDGKSLILRENASEQALVDILDREKPVKRNIDANKVAHISAERWSKFIEFEPNAYLTRIPIQQFLDMTTESYVEQRQLNARSTQISKKVAASDIKNTAGEYMYLEIDLKNKKVTNHEGRHRMTALLNAGNAYADVFVIPVNDAGIDSYGNIEVQGQFNTDKHNLGLVRAKSSKFAAAIEQVFKADDGNIRYALPENDSNGSSLTKEQQDFFKDSAIRADMIDGWKEISPNGALLPVYHGTNSSEFFEFDKSTIGTANDMGWYGKGFYFAFSESEAATYGRNVMECYLNIKKPFIFDEQMQSFDGINDGDVQFDFASFVINIADKFPAIAKKLTVDVVNEFNSYGEGTSTEINFAELSKQIKEIYNNKRLQVTTIQDGSNTFWAYKFKSNIENLEIEPEIRNIMDENYIRHAFAAEMALRNNKITKAQYDKILELFDKYGEQEFETKFLNARFYSEADAIESRLSAAVSYLSEYKYSYLEQHIPEHFMQQIGNEFNSELRKQGYDGVIQSRKGDEIVAFESNQIKLTSNKKPTDSNDIRYALDSNEDIKNLVAIHNTTESKLLQSIELGGLPMPSIAIIKSDMGHENFGNISLILKSEAIDPQKHYDNKVYSADAYSPRFPQVDYSLNGKELKILADKMDTSVSMLEANDFAEGKSRDRIIDSLKYNDDFIKHYLKEFSMEKEIIYKEPSYSSAIYYNDDIQEFFIFFYSFTELVKNEEVRQKLQNAVEKAKDKKTAEFKKNMLQHDYDRLNTALDEARDDKFLYEVLEKDYNNDKLIAQGKAEQVVDTYATRQNLIEKLKDDKQFNDYVESVVDKVLKKKYLRNNKDYYTNLGNPRSFESLHEEYTAENAVELMKEQGSKNSEGGNIFGFGIGEIRAALSKIYNNISEMHQDEYKLQNVSDDSSLAYEECNTELHDIAERISTKIKTGNFLEERDIALNAVFDIISSTKTNEQAKRLIKREYRFDISDAEILNIRRLAKKVAELPVKYFEAKPERVVNFNEIVEVIAPVGTSSKVVNFFNEQGIKIELYDENTSSRSDLIKNLPDNVRFALQEDENNTIGGLTKGQRAKFVANNTKFKVYSKLDATEVINSIISERLVLDDKYGTLSGKSKAEVIDRLFTKLNSANEGYRTGVALNIADYILENAVLEDMYDLTDNSEDMRVLSVLRSYMHNINLSGIQEEIKYKYDNKNNINLIWGNKNSKQTPDIIAQELAEFGIFIDAVNEADIFFQMVDKYESARAAVNKKVETIKLKTYGSKAKIEELRQQIARDILLAYDEKGEKSKYAKLVEKYTDKIANLTKQVKEADKKNKLVNSVIDSAQYLKSVADKRSYVGAEVFNAPELTSWLKELGKLKYRSDLRKAGARTLLLNYGKFYNTSNPLLYDSDPNLNYIDENVIDAINFIKANENSTAPLSYEELQAAQVIMASAKHLFQNYDQMILEGKKVRISEAAANGIAILQQSKNRVGKGFFNNIYGMFNKIVEPRAVIKSLENYNPDGILTRAYKQITDGETASGLMYIDLVSEFDNFFKTNKKYKKRLTSEYVKVGDAELTIGQAISLYELSKREQAQAGLYESGFSYLDKKGAKQSVRITERNIQELAKNFTESDKQFVAIVEDFFNVKSKNAKTAADLEILGYTNASEDFYFPIKRDSGTIAKNITDARSIMSDWANVYNFSFNKDVKAGSKNKLFITDVYSVVSRHAKQLSTYANLTVPLKNFSQLYAKNIGSKTDVRTIKNTVNEQVWDGADRYLSKLFADIQGRATSSSFIEKLRGAYAKYQLGANLKVIVSQVTSYPTAGVILDIDSMAKGAVMKTNYKALDEYCAYAKVRNYEKGVVRAEGVIDKVGKVGDVLTKPIQWTDRLTIGKLWNACQVQVQKDNGHKIGTVENMKAAGVLLEEVVRLTQPNYTNTERSELMRSDSDIVRSFTMFTSVPLKQLSRLVESVGEFRALRQMIKSGNASTEVAARYKIAKRKLSRTLASITVANLMYVLVGQFFKWLYNKDREDKEGNKISFIQDLTNDFVSTNIGMFPVVKDIYNFFVNDYEFSNFAYETVESVLSASKELFELATKAANGEIVDKSEYMRPLRNSLYAIGQITGIPVRNINNLFSGLMKRFDPASAYKYNSMFYNAKYSHDIKEALANGDTKLAETIMSLLLNEDKAGDVNAAVRKKLIELYSKEYTVLPKSIGDSVSYNGETIKLSKEQRTKFKKVYSQANSHVENMILSKTFNSLSEEKQAKAIKQLYDAYYAKALSETLGVEHDNKLLEASKFVDIASLSVIFAGISEITSDKNSNGATITGSKKAKVIKYLLTQKLTDEQALIILAYHGYTIKDKEYKGLSEKQIKTKLLRYILGLKSATQAEKAKLAELCGFEVRNGRIITQTPYRANK